MPRVEADQSAQARQGEARNRLLAELPSADFTLIAPHLTERSLQKGAVLQENGSAIEHVLFPHSGLVSLLLAVPDGRSAEIAMIGREGAVGLTAGIGSQIAVGTAVAQTPGTAAMIAAPRLARLVGQSKAIQDMVCRYNDALLAQTAHMVACNALHDVQARLARWLLQAQDRVGDNAIAITQETLAELLCVRRTTVTLVCGALQTDGAIHVRRGRVEILDAHALEKAACSCYAATRAFARASAAPAKPTASWEASRPAEYPRSWKK
jgi:CRP-like cAMP-binding protein